MPRMGLGLGLRRRGGAALWVPTDVAGLGAWWDLDHSTVGGGILTALVDRGPLGLTLNIEGAPVVVSIGGKDFVRCDETDDVIWAADEAGLDGAAGVTWIVKHANATAFGAISTLCQKGKAGTHFNGGLHTGGGNPRWSLSGGSGGQNQAGPLVEFSTPPETIAFAFESGVECRRVDGDGSFSTVATVITGVVGAGHLAWGARQAAVGFNNFRGVDLRAALFYNRPLPQAELEQAWAFVDAV